MAIGNNKKRDLRSRFFMVFKVLALLGLLVGGISRQR